MAAAQRVPPGDGYELESYIESSRTYTERIYVPIERE